MKITTDENGINDILQTFR